jgi:hypothetical protein
MSFAFGLTMKIKSNTKSNAALQGIHHLEVGLSLARPPPFLAFRTSCTYRRCSPSLRLAYGFTPLSRCCYQSLNQQFGVAWKLTGAFRSALSAVEARYSRVYLTRHLPTSGFHTLLPAYFFRSLPAIFIAVNTFWFFFLGFSPPQCILPISERVTFVFFAL